jgi:hypothetical protein
VADPVDDAAGRLYGLPLEDFTRERDALARELRREKQRDTAAAIAKLAKPSQAAWIANQLAREQRDLVDDLLAAGEALREAQEAALAGKGAAALRDAGAAERAAVDALMNAAKELRPGGRRPSEATLERLRNTLHASAANEDVRAALATGRLVEDAEATAAYGLLDAAALAVEPPARPARQRAAKAGEPRSGGRRKAAREESPAEREAAEREAAERAAAEREAAERERERRQQLEAELREARAERRAQDRELARAERDVKRAEDRLESALAAAETAREQAEEARAELESARQTAEAARDHVARLEEQLD